MDLWMYIAIIILGVIIAFWGLKNGKLLATVVGAAVAIWSSFGAGII